MTTTSRPTLGNFMSLVCFQYLRVGTEDVADRAPIVSAGRKRGYDLVEELGLLGSTADAALIQRKLAEALGADGTRLCLVTSVTANTAGGYEVRIREGACTAGQVSPEPLCAFTMGVFIGALYAITGKPMRGQEVACCACGAQECIYQIEPIVV
jgi:predicted hydrocarbon binding protein